MGAVNMISCHLYNLVTSLILLLVLTGSKGTSIKDQDAGFYTTRFGRSDPSLRMQELTTRYSPDSRVLRSSEWQNRYMPRLWEMIEDENKFSGMPPLVCHFSIARSRYSCSKADPWSVSPPDDELTS